MPRKAELHFDGRVIPLDIVEGSEGERAIDIRKLRDETGIITLDPGYANTGSCESDITFIDGEQGILRYRGYDIADLAERCSFVEVAYLLIQGELHSKPELTSFSKSLTYHSMLHEDFRQFYRVLPKDAHPMAACSAVVGALATFYPDSLDPRNPRQVEVSVHRLIAKLPTIAAYADKKSIGQPFMYPRNELNYCENFLRMMFTVPSEEYEIDPDFVEALNLLLVVHADHEQNCSTSTVRMVGSSVDSLDHLQEVTDNKLEAWSKHALCPATGKTVYESWEEEIEHLGKLPILPEPFDVVVTRPVHKDCRVNFENRSCPVPFAHVGQTVEVRGCDGKVQILSCGRIIREYPRHTQELLLVDPTCYEGEPTDRVLPPPPLGRMGRKLQEIWEMPVPRRPLNLYAALAEVAR